MKYPEPCEVARLTYIGSDGVWRYRNNEHVPTKCRNKPTPCIGDTAYLGDMVIDKNVYEHTFNIANAYPPDAPANEVFHGIMNSVDPDMMRDLMTLQTVRQNAKLMGTLKEAYKHQGMAVKKFYQAGATIELLAQMFLISEHKVKTLLHTNGVKTSNPEKKSRANRDTLHYRTIRASPQYNQLTHMIRISQVRAITCGKGIKFQVSLTDVFKTEDGEVLLPKVCPVLGIPLTYSKSTVNDDAAVVWRTRRTGDITPDNVAIMSKAASRMIEGTMSRATQDRLLVEWTPEHDALTHWRAWQERHPAQEA